MNMSHMFKFEYGFIYLILLSLFGVCGTFLDLNDVRNHVLQWKNQNFHNISEVAVASNGIFDLSDVKNKILQWKTQKLTALCPSNGPQLMNLLYLVCYTAQATNVTTRDACVSCFSKVTSMSEGPQELNALSVCAMQYLTNTSYANCASSLMALSTSALNVQPSGCYMGYCDFARCLRRTNSINLITQCTREARTGVNITLDSDNVRFYTNVTSCILAKTRCSPYNPITGELPQKPGYSSTGVRFSNALQFSNNGELKVLTFPANIPVSSLFCSATSNLTQTNWLTNVC